VPSLAQEIRDYELREARMRAAHAEQAARAATARLLAAASAPPAPPATPPPEPPPPPEPEKPKNLGMALLMQIGPNPFARHPRVAPTGPANKDLSQTFALIKPRPR
jgi:hypothetical protein